jgi:starch synthase (maltosyl-transferring)
MGYFLEQTPEPGKYLIFREGDFMNVYLIVRESLKGIAYLRTNLFNPEIKREEQIARTEKETPGKFQEWGDIPMTKESEYRYRLALPLDSIGFFEAKAYFIPESEREPLWPEGDNLLIKVEPADSVISNSIYCAFVRLFAGESLISAIKRDLETLESYKDHKFSIIPNSGKFRNLIEQVDFIVDDLGFDIIMLLPVHPVPTTYARMGLFGSPYAVLDFMNVDPALAEFDKETTPLEQFGELVDAVHAKHARIFMDIPVNHTGWASQLQIHHPEFFVKNDEGKFVSPGAWGVTWSDLSELDYSHKALWKYMAEVFLFWCRRGVDGFRCDAGYMLPADAWQYITAKVRNEYPSTIFLLEGLGGKVSTTEELLTHSNLNWAYSEMFQNYNQNQMEWYLEEFKRISMTKGPLVNFSETHDNNRLASVSKAFSRLRNGLTALFSDTGTYAITCGVEWFATEKIDVHRLTSLNWGDSHNQITYIKRLNNILKSHPTFTGDFTLTKMHNSHLNSIAYLRHSHQMDDKLAVIANLSAEENEIYLDKNNFREFIDKNQDLLSGEDVNVYETEHAFQISLQPYQISALCNKTAYFYKITDQRINRIVKETKAERILGSQILQLFPKDSSKVTEAFIQEKTREFKTAPYDFFFCNFHQRPPVIRWIYPRDVNREVVIPDNTPVLIIAPGFFRYSIRSGSRILGHGEGFFLKEEKFVSIIAPVKLKKTETTLQLDIEYYKDGHVTKKTGNLMLAVKDKLLFLKNAIHHPNIHNNPISNALSVNSRAGISVSSTAFGIIKSKYDALISANLNPTVPDDRHIMFTRLRGWSVYKGFSRAITPEYQKSFHHNNNITVYYFEIPAGSGMFIPLTITYLFDNKDNLLNISVKRKDEPTLPSPPAEDAVKIILRPDIESRNHHELTKAFMGAEHEWPANTEENTSGFVFHDKGHSLQIHCQSGKFVREDEWYYSIPHPIEEERGMDSEGDLFSPGYFQLSLKHDESVQLSARIEKKESAVARQVSGGFLSGMNADADKPHHLKEKLRQSIRQFIVDRNNQHTVIAGYPWFLDWGRDTLICLRGILSAGFITMAKNIIREFAAFENKGTLPNLIRGKDTSNRDTSDAPLWMFVAVKDLISLTNDGSFLEADCGGRSLSEVLISIAANYMQGTPNGIRMDEQSKLVYSPTHFTWMDTNYPAGTPRAGYPIEIQALWYHALHFLSDYMPHDGQWGDLADKVKASIKALFLIEKQDYSTIFQNETYLSDCLHSNHFCPAASATPDDHLRPNQLLAVTLAAISDEPICRGIVSACEELIVPGAIRTLADRLTAYQLPVYQHGQLLNKPGHPYMGRYLGEEDHTRKPAFHNGTAWTWPFPSYCEALLISYGKAAREQAKNLLSTSMIQLNAGCMAHIPEIMDGNFPHEQRGCYAQAWGITEFYRVAMLLGMI